jgi:phosphotransferase system enzyme I (PtsI)
MTERVLHGRPASPGLAIGQIVALAAADRPHRAASGDPAAEAAVLRDALGAALAETQALQQRVEGEAADMIAFQAGMLEDEELAAPAFAIIAEGSAADAAWQVAMDEEIAGYAAAEDAYFRARTADLQDIRDRVLARLRPEGHTAAVAPGAIVAAADLPLSRFLGIDWNRGGAILLTEGSATSHVAMLARARGIPMIVGLGGAARDLDGRTALVDAETGEVIVDARPASRARFEAKLDGAREAAQGLQATLAASAVTVDGTRIAMHLNVVGAEELRSLDPAICDGIGLFRTEFLFHGPALPDEETQYAAYRAVVEWAAGRPVTIRTLDAGGDKPIPGVTVDGESNPFLGLRGLRLSLRNPDLFRVQLRAILRAARHGRLRVMLPMVTVPQELAAARTLLESEFAVLSRAGHPAPMPELGIMVEVPAVAIAIERFDAAFFSVGSNDLTQYVTAAGRDIAAVADLADPADPAVLRLIAGVVRHGHATGRDVSLCGDAGGDPAVIPALLAAGLRSLSVSPGQLARAKRAVSTVDLRAVPK